jgi:sporulation protein YlmC with PRC-barrel domain
MADALGMVVEIGAEGRCLDGSCGQVSRVVIDPVTSAVTHLVVDTNHQRASGRLVPVDLVATIGARIALRCSRTDFDKLDSAEEGDYLPEYGGYKEYTPDEVYALPYFGLGTNMRLGGSVGMDMGWRYESPAVHDTVPLGEVDIHRGEPVRATDGDIGRVHGLVIDPHNHQVTHVLLQEGHFWGSKQVAIPIKAITRVGGMVVDLTREQLQALPPVDLTDPGL